jgi:hypothetical protein
MRTTVTLDPDVDALLRRRMREHGESFKRALNDAVRAGLGAAGEPAFRTRTFPMGEPAVPLDKALQLAAQIEDEELLRRLAARR